MLWNNIFRSRIARADMNQLREAVVEKIRDRVRIELWAVSKIQAFYRGCVGRTLFDKKVLERKGIWKELFDGEKRKRFFYNKITGEVRWKMPQDLLDLVPKPICDNCCTCEAIVECSSCSEFFCSACWDQVHYGGRRKNHEFRALYDYYGKRLDFGDSDGVDGNDGDGVGYRDTAYPCKWPSDIVQDEIHGWMLRISPTREPTSVCGAWESYGPGSGAGTESSTGSRSFYFNRQTFEATYTPPKDFNANISLQDSENQSTSYFQTTENFDPSGICSTQDPYGALELEQHSQGVGNRGHYDANGLWVYEFNHPVDAVPSSSFRW